MRKELRRRLGRGLVTLSCCAAMACGQKPAADPAKTATPAAKVLNPKAEADLATITLSAEAAAHLAIEIAEAAMADVTATRTVGGEAMVPPGRTVTVSAPVAGTLSPAPGASIDVGPVKKGAALFELMPLQPSDRDARANAERDVQETEARLRESDQRLRRLEGLLKDGSTSQRLVEEARADRAAAEAAAAAATSRLAGLQHLRVGPRGELTLAAPFDGTVTAIRAAAGQTVAAGAPVFELSQVDSLWVRVALYAGDLAAVDANKPAYVAALGHETSGPWHEARRVSGPPSANAAAASVDLYFAVPAAAGRVRPGERLAVRLRLDSAASERAIVIPQSAVVYDLTGGTWVYEVKGDHVYARRRVELAGPSGASVVVRRGLSAGVRIVTVGAAELYGTEFYVSK